MVYTVEDPKLIAALKAADPSGLELRGPAGEVLGYVSKPYGVPPAGYVPPIAAEEIARRRELYKDHVGLTLDDVWKEIHGRQS